MKLLRIILIIGALLAVLFFVMMTLGYRMVTRSLPRVSGQVSVSDLSQETSIFRDNLHVPHILGNSESDVIFAQGFATSQDRFWQMELNRRTAKAQLQTLFQSAANHTDSLMAELKIHEKMDDVYDKLSPASIKVLESYTDGVNAYLKAHAEGLPIEFKLLDAQPEPWTVKDCLSVLALYLWKKSSKWRFSTIDTRVFDISRLKQVYKEGFIPRSSGKDWSGFIAGTKSKSGDSYWLLRPGYATVQPALWYEINLISPLWNIHGLSLPGFPSVLLGHNTNFAWALLCNGGKYEAPDTDDLSSSIKTLFTGFLTDAKIWDRPHKDTIKSGFQVVFADSNGCLSNSRDDKKKYKTDSRILNYQELSFINQRFEQILQEKPQFTAVQLERILTDTKSILAQEIVEIIKPALESWSPKSENGERLKKDIGSWNYEVKAGSREALFFQVFISEYLKTTSRFRHDSVLADLSLRESEEELLNRFEKSPNEKKFHEAFDQAILACEERLGQDLPSWGWGGYRKCRLESAMNIHPLLTVVYTIGPLVLGGSGNTIQGNAHFLTNPERVVSIPSARLVLNLNELTKSKMGIPSGQSGQPLDSHYSDQVQSFLSNRLHSTVSESKRIQKSGWQKLTLQPRTP